MCAGSMIKASNEKIRRALGQQGLVVNISSEISREEWDQLAWGFGRKFSKFKVEPYDKCPIVINRDGELLIDELEFSLTPFWGKDYPLKNHTYNARMNRPKGDGFEYVYQVPSYRGAFSNGKFCLIPISRGIESAYAGEYDQKRFSFFACDREFTFITGLWDEWVNKQTGEVHRGFAMLTSYPNEEMREFGHHREVLVNKPEIWHKLLDGKKKDKKFYDELRESREHVPYKAELFQELKTRSGAPEKIDFAYPKEDLKVMGPDGNKWLQDRISIARK